MKRGWLGLGILLVFLALGLWSSRTVERIYTPLTRQLEEASAVALSGDLERGMHLAQAARDTWHAYWRKTAALSNHAPMDEIDALFSRTVIFAQAGNRTDFAAHCAQLSALVEACAEAHRLTWWNLF